MTEEKLTLEGLLKETKEQPFMAAGFAVIVFVIFALVMEIFSMLLRGSLVNPDAVARVGVVYHSERFERCDRKDQESQLKAIITGSAGLVGSACAAYLAKHGFEIVGLDNGARGAFFPTSGVVFDPLKLDIRNRGGVEILVRDTKPDLIVHCAAQPSHDLAASIPHIDFETNAVGTLNLLEAARQYCPESPFVFMSTNKVYGDTPNRSWMWETEKRFEISTRCIPKEWRASGNGCHSTRQSTPCSAAQSSRLTSSCRSTAVTSGCRPYVSAPAV